ncbi:hypothetical protein VTI74DRAFT_6142 [Chaetomium olivicolor]
MSGIRTPQFSDNLVRLAAGILGLDPGELRALLGGTSGKAPARSDQGEDDGLRSSRSHNPPRLIPADSNLPAEYLKSEAQAIEGSVPATEPTSTCQQTPLLVGPSRLWIVPPVMLLVRAMTMGHTKDAASDAPFHLFSKRRKSMDLVDITE